MHGYKITNLRYADDIDLVSTSSEQLQQSLDEVTERANKAVLQVNVGKTKSMTFGEQHPPTPIKVEDKEVDTVEEFEYLGSLITWDNDCSKEIKRRIGKAYTGHSQVSKNCGTVRPLVWGPESKYSGHVYLASYCMPAKPGP